MEKAEEVLWYLVGAERIRQVPDDVHYSAVYELA
jgi:hypothetical protein